MIEKAGEDYLTSSGKLEASFAWPQLGIFGDEVSVELCGFRCGIMRNMSEFRLISIGRK